MSLRLRRSPFSFPSISSGPLRLASWRPRTCSARPQPQPPLLPRAAVWAWPEDRRGRAVLTVEPHRDFRVLAAAWADLRVGQRLLRRRAGAGRVGPTLSRAYFLLKRSNTKQSANSSIASRPPRWPAPAGVVEPASAAGRQTRATVNPLLTCALARAWRVPCSPRAFPLDIPRLYYALSGLATRRLPVCTRVGQRPRFRVASESGARGRLRGQQRPARRRMPFAEARAEAREGGRLRERHLSAESVTPSTVCGGPPPTPPPRPTGGKEGRPPRPTRAGRREAPPPRRRGCTRGTTPAGSAPRACSRPVLPPPASPAGARVRQRASTLQRTGALLPLELSQGAMEACSVSLSVSYAAGPRAESRQGLACAQSPRAPREAGSPLAGKGTLLAPPGVSGPGQARRRSIRVDPTRMRARAPRRNSPSPTGSSDWIWLSPEHASRLLRVSYSRESAPRVLSAAISRAPVGRRDGCHGGVPAAAPPRIPATVTSPFAAAVATRNLMARTAARADGVRVPGPSGPP